MRLAGIAAGVMAAAALAAAPRQAQAGVRVGIILVDHRSGYEYGHGDAYRLGLNRGYQDGYDHGAKDADHHDSFDFAHDRRYRKGDAGYRGWYGPKWDYVAGYRRGYDRGYRRAYASVGRYDERGRYDSRYGRGGYRYDPSDRELYRDDRDRDDDDNVYEAPDRRY